MIVRRTYKLLSKLEHFCEIKGALLTVTLRICLEAQWLRIHLLCRGHGFDPWSVRIPHVLCVCGGVVCTILPVCLNYRAHELQLLKPGLCNKRVTPTHRT